VKFSETSVTVHPGQTQELTAHFTPPSGLDPSLLPVYSGFVQIESATETLHVTYLGVAAALEDATQVDTTNVFFGVDLPVITDPAGDFITNATNFTFIGQNVFGLLMRLDFGTPLLRIDLVDANENVPTTLNKRASFGFPQPAAGTSGQVKIVGTLVEDTFVGRNSDENVSHLMSFRVTRELMLPTGRYRLQPLRVRYADVREWHNHPKWAVQTAASCAQGDRQPQ
jgi:hypothetical protein